MDLFPAGHWLKPVSSGISVGATFNCHFINVLDDGISGIILKFANDTKFMGKVSRVDEIEKLRGNLKQFGTWSKEWQMVFNADKCKLLHFGHNNGQQGKFITLWMIIFLNLLRKNRI